MSDNDDDFEATANICEVCGDRCTPWLIITIAGVMCCSGECAADINRELWAEELAARPAVECTGAWDCSCDSCFWDITTPIPVRIDGVSYPSLKAARS